MNKFLLGFFAAILGCVAQASDAPPPHDMSKMWKASLAKPSLAVSAVFDERGCLWRASARDGHVRVSYSDDGGKSWSQPVEVNPEPENIAADGENRPKIKVAKNGEVYVSYTQSLETPFSGNIRFSRSTDGGRSFSAPITVNDNRDPISHRFDALGVNVRGQVYVAWLDKRDIASAEKQDGKYRGLAVYYAVSDDGGVSFRPNAKAADHSCECCRVAMAMDLDGAPVIVWRHVFGKNSRDHALTKLGSNAAPLRVSFDDWQVDACPHHGPAISIGRDGVYHLVWFNNAPARHGLFYAQSADGGKTLSTPMSFGNYEAQAGHPSVLSLGKKVFIAWREFTGEVTEIYLMDSADGGKTWLATRKIAATSGASDYPLLIEGSGQAYLSWNTTEEGYRLIRVTKP